MTHEEIGHSFMRKVGALMVRIAACNNRRGTTPEDKATVITRV